MEEDGPLETVVKRIVRTHSSGLAAGAAEDPFEVTVDRRADTVSAIVSSPLRREPIRLQFEVLSQMGPHWVVSVDGRVLEALVTSNSPEVTVQIGTDQYALTVHDPRDRSLHEEAAVAAGGSARVTAQMPGRIVRVLVGVGERVEAHQGLVVIEAMKMQNEIRAPRAGRIAQIEIGQSGAVSAGQLLFLIEDWPEPSPGAGI